MSLDCYTCPEPANYAAIALLLQKTALDAEGCIYPLEAQLRSASNRPTIISITSSAPSIVVNTRTQIATSTTTTFANSESLTTQTTLPAGIYEAGVWLNATAAGAVTDNSFRQLEIVVRGVNDASTVPDVYNAYAIIYESNNGSGMDMMLNTTVTLDGTQAIRYYFTHANAGSNVVIAAGAILWVTKISDLTIPRVVI